MVKRAGPVSDGGFTDSMPVSGSKRTVRDRLGNDEYSTSLYGGHSNNKRCVCLYSFIRFDRDLLFYYPSSNLSFILTF